jgi:hypothetical protein
MKAVGPLTTINGAKSQETQIYYMILNQFIPQGKKLK